MKYGNAPKELGIVLATCQEMMHYQCLPIKLIDTPEYRLPERLKWVQPLLDRIRFTEDRYVYLTVRNTFISPGSSGSRPGWHSDGFLTDDINYIWSDCLPTEFALQNFDIDENCLQSLQQFEEQVHPENIATYPAKMLLQLNSGVIHRPAINDSYEGLRQFVKVSVSKHRYNLAGNSHNYLLDYNWPMVERSTERNHQTSYI